jgi:hypothetical protein
MKNVRVAVHIPDDGQSATPRYQLMAYHLVFNVKFDGFKFKLRMVAGGHMVEVPSFFHVYIYNMVEVPSFFT